MSKKIKKKKPVAQPPLQPVAKAGIFKRAERALFKVFNGKSRRRHKIIMAIMLTPPAMGISHFWHNDPSTERQQGGVEQVEIYRTEINAIARDSRAFAISPDGVLVRGDAAQLVALDRRMQALAHHLALDANISEQDAIDLTRQFMRDINDPVIGKPLRSLLTDLVENGAYLEEARRSLSRTSGDTASQAPTGSEVVAKAETKSERDYLYDFLFAFFWINLIFGDNFRSLLTKATRRSEKLQHEEKKEQFVDHIMELRAMLTPKGAAPAPTTTPQPDTKPSPRRK